MASILASKISSFTTKAKRDLRRASERASRTKRSVQSKAKQDVNRASEAAERKKRELKQKARQDIRRAPGAAAQAKETVKTKAKRDVNRAELAARQKATDLRYNRESGGIGGRLADAGEALATGGPGVDGALTTEERRMVAGAEETAMMGAPIADATLEPLSAPQQTEFLTHSGGLDQMAVDSLLFASPDGGVEEPMPLIGFGMGEDGEDGDRGQDPGGLEFDGTVLFGGGRDGR